MCLGANTAALFMNLTPVFTAIIAVLFLHEQSHSYHLLGGDITLLSVILSKCLPNSWGQRAKIPTTWGGAFCKDQDNR